MSGASYTLPLQGPSSASGLTDQDVQDQRDRLFGRDIWFDVTQGQNANYGVTAAGDWVLADGEEALRQRLLRRIITNPGEWQTLPEFGAGARLYVKARDTPAMRDELEEKIRGQLAQDIGVASVSQVVIERLTDGPGLKVFIQVIPSGGDQRRKPLVASIEVN